MTDQDNEFEPHYWIGKLYVDSPGHTSWEGSKDVTEDIAEARDLLETVAGDSPEINSAIGILEDLLVDVKLPGKDGPRATVGTVECQHCGDEVSTSTFHPPEEKTVRCGNCMTLNTITVDDRSEGE